MSPPPPSPPGPHGARKPLLMSSAKMMLVRRAGWDRRACTTALREHCCSSRPSGSILATSGRVDDLQQRDESALPEAAAEAGLRPEAAPDSQLRQLQPASDSGASWAGAPLLGTGSAHPSSRHRSGDTWKHPYVQQSWQDNSLQLEITISGESAYRPQGGGQARCPLISRLGRAHGSFPYSHLRPRQALQTQSPPAGTMRPGTAAQHTQDQGYVKAGRRAGKRSN